MGKLCVPSLSWLQKSLIKLGIFQSDPSTVVLINQIEINSEDDLPTLNIGGTDYKAYAPNTVYLFRQSIVWTMGLVADGLHSTNSITEFQSSIGLTQDFTGVSPIFFSDASHIGGIILCKDLGMTGSPTTTSLFNENPVTPTKMFAFNGNNIIFTGIKMGSFSGTVVLKNTNITEQKSPLDLQVSGFDFIYINAISVVGETGVSFGGSHIKINGTTAGFLNITTINAIPSSGDTMFDFTGISTPGINLLGVTHITALGSGGIYAVGSPDFSSPLLKVSASTGTDNPDSDSLADTSFIGNGLQTSIGVIGTPVKTNAVWTDNAKERFTINSNGTITYIGIEDVTILVSSICFQRPVSGGTTNLSTYIAKNGSVIASSQGRHNASAVVGTQCTSETLVVLSTGDTIEHFTANEDTTDNIIVEDCKLILKK